MTTDRLERALPDILLDLYLQSDVPYRNDIVGRTGRTRQQPAWRFPGRWLPMAHIPRERVTAPGLPWRTIGVGLVIVALLVGAFVVIGSRRPTLPPPFGVAKAGLVAFSQDGDIFVADHLSGTTTAIVTGPDDDSNPRWSLDGTRIAFTRRVPTAGAYRLYVVQADGSGLTLVTPRPLQTIKTYMFSPDGRAILIGGSSRVVVDGINTTDRSIFIAEADGSGLRTIDVGMIVTSPTYRPPTGEEIAFVGAKHEQAYPGIYAVNADGSGIRTIVEPIRKQGLDGAMWSPDGTRLAYFGGRVAADGRLAVHVVSADGTGDTVVGSDGSWNAVLAWANDGTRLAIIRGNDGGSAGARIVAIPVDGSGPGVEMQVSDDPTSPCCLAYGWAPDDSTIVGARFDARGDPLAHVLWDPTTGEMTPAPWVATSPPSWQRLAP